MPGGRPLPGGHRPSLCGRDPPLAGRLDSLRCRISLPVRELRRSSCPRPASPQSRQPGRPACSPTRRVLPGCRCLCQPRCAWPPPSSARCCSLGRCWRVGCPWCRLPPSGPPVRSQSCAWAPLQPSSCTCLRRRWAGGSWHWVRAVWSAAAWRGRSKRCVARGLNPPPGVRTEGVEAGLDARKACIEERSVVGNYVSTAEVRLTTQTGPDRLPNATVGGGFRPKTRPSRSWQWPWVPGWRSSCGASPAS